MLVFMTTLHIKQNKIFFLIQEKKGILQLTQKTQLNYSKIAGKNTTYKSTKVWLVEGTGKKVIFIYGKKFNVYEPDD